jgi:hypothetical protein
MNDKKPIELTKLERLAALLRDDGIDPETMNADQLAQYLKVYKVDMSDPQKRFASVLKKSKARQSLEFAHERRQKAVDKSKAILSAGADAVEAVKEKVRVMIKNLGQHDPDQAQVYAREFEKATPEDLAVLEEDLTLLEMEASENDKGDSQNPR